MTTLGYITTLGQRDRVYEIPTVLASTRSLLHAGVVADDSRRMHCRFRQKAYRRRKRRSFPRYWRPNLRPKLISFAKSSSLTPQRFRNCELLLVNVDRDLNAQVLTNPGVVPTIVSIVDQLTNGGFKAIIRDDRKANALAWRGIDRCNLSFCGHHFSKSHFLALLFRHEHSIAA